jgi:hypothetical protein
MLDAIESLKERWFSHAGGAGLVRPNENRPDRRFVDYYISAVVD